MGMLLQGAIQAQNETDALRYSFLMNSGTARFSAMGSSFSALGADFSVLSTNPAGIGLYKKSEFMMTPSISFSGSTSTFNGSTGEDSKASFAFPNIGLVFTGDVSSSGDKPEWKNIQFGFGVNRVADFNSSYFMQGDNNGSSILDVYKYYADGHEYTNLNAFDTELAWNTWLLDTAGGTSNYVKAFDGGVLQQKSISTSGGINEMVISFGGNYNDKFYLGATMGFPFLRYNEDAFYKEIDEGDSLNYFNSLSVNDEINTTGAGFNFKLGMVYRITDWVRLSAAVHTPTFYAMHDTYSRFIRSDLETASYESTSPQGIYDYRLSTPMRMIAGLAFVIGKHGAISAEYEMVDYSQARLRSTDVMYDFFDANEAIGATYQVANNFRAGGELILAPFAIRGGFSYYGSPYANSVNDYSTMNITGGFGIRESNYYIDLAYVHSLRSEEYYFYSPTIVDGLGKTLTPVTSDVTKGTFLITMGFKFGE